MAVKSNNPIVAKINKNFLIRWKEQGDKKMRLISAGRYHFLVGDDFADKHFEKVLTSGLDTYQIKLRRGLTIHFVSR